MTPGTSAGGRQPFGGSPDIGESVGAGRNQKKVPLHGWPTSSTISKVLLTKRRPALQEISISKVCLSSPRPVWSGRPWSQP